jgi:hypothetical protein
VRRARHVHSTAKSARQRVRAFLKRLGPVKSAIVAFGGTASAVGAILALVFVIRPELQPSTDASGSINSVAILDSGLPLGQYCARRRVDCNQLDKNKLKWPGDVISIAVETHGYAHKNLPLKWSVYNATIHQRVADLALNDQQGWPDGGYIPSKGHDSNQLEIWVPFPAKSGEYFVLLELFPDAGARLDSKESAPFVVRE